MINLQYKLNQNGGHNLINVIKECNMTDKQHFLNKEFTNTNIFVTLDVEIFSEGPFKTKPQVPLFHKYHDVDNTPLTTFKISNNYYDNIPTAIKDVIGDNIDSSKVDLFFVVSFETGYMPGPSLFRPHYYYLPYDGKWGGKGEGIQFNPKAGLYGNSNISSDTGFINNFIKINGLSAHDELISSDTHKMNWNGEKPLSVWSVVNDAKGGWTKCAVTLHWIVDFDIARDLRDISRSYNTFNKLLPQLESKTQYNNLIPSLKKFLL